MIKTKKTKDKINKNSYQDMKDNTEKGSNEEDIRNYAKKDERYTLPIDVELNIECEKLREEIDKKTL